MYMTKTETEIIERIESQMKMKGFTQDKLAKCLGIKQYNVSRMLIGKPFPSIDQLFLIAANLDCSIQYLLGIKEETFTELSKDAASIAHAYNSSSDEIKLIIMRILNL